MTLLKDDTFYWPWPILEGIPLNEQWDKIRTDTELLSPIVQSTYYENTDGIRGHASLAGYEFGSQSFPNQYRIVYIDASNEFHFQCNHGTLNTPDWHTLFHLDCDGPNQIQFDQNVLFNAGFYPQLQITVKDGVHTFRDDTLSFNNNHFYLSKDSNGNPEVNSKIVTLQDVYDNGNGQINATTIKPFLVSGTGDVTYINSPNTSAGDLVFIEDLANIKWVIGKNNGGNFRIKGSSGGSIFQIEPDAPGNTLTIHANGQISLGGSLIIDGSIIANSVTADVFYGTIEPPTPIIFKDGIRTFSDNTLSFNNSQFYLSADSQGNPEVNLIGSSGGLSSVTFKDGVHTFLDDTLNFNKDHFYLTQDSAGNPSVNFGRNVFSWDLNGFIDDVPEDQKITIKEFGRVPSNITSIIGRTNIGSVGVVLKNDNVKIDWDGDGPSNEIYFYQTQRTYVPTGNALLSRGSRLQMDFFYLFQGSGFAWTILGEEI